jgi:hypothetical protein
VPGPRVCGLQCGMRFQRREGSASFASRRWQARLMRAARRCNDGYSRPFGSWSGRDEAMTFPADSRWFTEFSPSGQAPPDRGQCWQLPLPRPLPRQVKPFPRETIESYLSRLARANRLDAETLRFYIAGRKGRSAPVPVARLAAIANLPGASLRYAIPDLDPAGSGPARSLPGVTKRHRNNGSACRRCVLARGSTGSVQCWKPPEDVVCLRHRRWIGAQRGEDQPDLSAQPGIVQAHKRHLRLVRHFGRDKVAYAYAAAYEMCRQWHNQFAYDGDFYQRMQVFHGPGPWAVSPDHPTISAAIYPQAVALTRLLASPYWQAQAASGISGQQRFAEEARRTAAPGFPWPQPGMPRDPLCQWIRDSGSYARSVWMITWP